MHELSIALSILDLAAERARSLEGRVSAIHLRLGPLSGVVREALISAYSLAREGTPLEETELVIESVPLLVFCSVCELEVNPPSIAELVCPACGGPTPEIRGGRELEVVALEIVS